MAKVETIGLITMNESGQAEVAVKEDFFQRQSKLIDGNVGKHCKITYDTSFDSRSAQQNRFFHSTILPAFMRCYTMLGVPGITSLEYVKEVMLKKPYLTVNKGQPDEYVRGTSSLSVGEFWEFCNQCLELLVTIGGGLNERETQEYLQIVERFHLNKAVDDTISRRT